MIARRRLFASALAVVSLAFVGARVSAQPAEPTPIEITVGATVTVPIPRRPMIIDTEDHAIATFEMQNDGTARVTGVAVGRTRIVGQDYASVPILIPLNVVAAAPSRGR
jgi:Pilus formation protein N terminal region